MRARHRARVGTGAQAGEHLALPWAQPVRQREHLAAFRRRARLDGHRDPVVGHPLRAERDPAAAAEMDARPGRAGPTSGLAGEQRRADVDGRRRDRVRDRLLAGRVELAERGAGGGRLADHVEPRAEEHHRRTGELQPLGVLDEGPGLGLPDGLGERPRERGEERRLLAARRLRRSARAPASPTRRTGPRGRRSSCRGPPERPPAPARRARGRRSGCAPAVAGRARPASARPRAARSPTSVTGSVRGQTCPSNGTARRSTSTTRSRSARASSGSRQIRSTRSSTPEVDTRRAYGAGVARTPENMGYQREPRAPIVEP